MIMGKAGNNKRRSRDIAGYKAANYFNYLGSPVTNSDALKREYTVV